jgi:hypothetical protein
VVAADALGVVPVVNLEKARQGPPAEGLGFIVIVDEMDFAWPVLMGIRAQIR